MLSLRSNGWKQGAGTDKSKGGVRQLLKDRVKKENLAWRRTRNRKRTFPDMLTCRTGPEHSSKVRANRTQKKRSVLITTDANNSKAAIVLLFWHCLLMISPTQIPLQVDIAVTPELIHTLSQWRKFSCDLFNLYRAVLGYWPAGESFISTCGACRIFGPKPLACGGPEQNWDFLQLDHKWETWGGAQVPLPCSCQTAVAKLRLSNVYN